MNSKNNTENQEEQMNGAGYKTLTTIREEDTVHVVQATGQVLPDSTASHTLLDNPQGNLENHNDFLDNKQLAETKATSDIDNTVNDATVLADEIEDSKKLFDPTALNRKIYTEALQPRGQYFGNDGTGFCEDVFAFSWGQKECAQVLECNLYYNDKGEGLGGIKFLLTEDGTIIGIEIERFKEYFDTMQKEDEESLENIKKDNSINENGIKKTETSTKNS